ncbi:alpha/beta fold hydrolase [Paraburkholderia sp. RL17-373-BIF-A]|uniref:alpha/beta fold hydrolase n=1 Tax=Paraburkholderia sp. RL17-373-BIF-A TaxID=3031629 RepID=UPI0038BA2DEB
MSEILRAMVGKCKLLLIAAFTFFVAGCGDSPNNGSAKFVIGTCPSRVASSPAFANARCGQLVVPENRQRPNAKTISISVAIIPSVVQPPQHEPVFLIAGGPGGDAMVDAGFLVPTLNRTQDLIVSAQRGTLDATPALLCPEIDAFNAKAVSLVYGAPSTKALHVAATKACHDRLISDGVDLSAYNTFENIEDFVDLGKVLNLSKWSIFGTSYGTYVALTLMRTHPEHLVSVTIDSVVPPSVASLSWPWTSAGEGFNNLFDACAAQPSCASRYGDVKVKFTSQVRALEEHPLTTTSTYQPGGPPIKVVLDGGALVDWFVANGRSSFYSIPSAIQELTNGDPVQIAASRAALAGPAPQSIQAYGLTYGVFCSEWIPYEPQSEILTQGRLAFPNFPDSVLSQTPQLPFATEDCAVWDVPRSSRSIRDITTSTIPTLIIDGTFDSKTSPMWAKYAGRSLANSTTIIVPGIGHFVTPQSPCVQAVVESFLANPSMKPDTECVARLSPAPFS